MLEKLTEQLVGAAVAGSGVTVAATWLWQRSNEWWKQPRIAIEVSNGAGHISETVLIKTHSHGGSMTQAERDAVFVRAKVTNTEGKYRKPETARGCVGFLAGLEVWDEAKGEFLPTEYHDFLRLGWSYNADSHGMDLLPGIPVWLDVVYVLPPNQQFEEAKLKVASNPPVNRYAEGFVMPGMYRIKVQLSGENIRAQSIQFYVLVPNGSNTPEVLDDSTWRSRLWALEPFTEEQIRALGVTAACSQDG